KNARHQRLSADVDGNLPQIPGEVRSKAIEAIRAEQAIERETGFEARARKEEPGAKSRLPIRSCRDVVGQRREISRIAELRRGTQRNRAAQLSAVAGRIAKAENHGLCGQIPNPACIETFLVNVERDRVTSRDDREVFARKEIQLSVFKILFEAYWLISAMRIRN